MLSRRSEQSIFVNVLIGQSIDAEILRVLRKTSFFDQVLDFKDVEAHVTHFLQELFLLFYEKVWLLFDLSHPTFHCVLLSQLILYLVFLMFMDLSWDDVVSLHKVQKLARYFLQDFFSKKPRIIFEFGEWHELNDVALHKLFIFVGVQRFIVSVKDIH